MRRDRRGRQHHGDGRRCSGHQHRRGGETSLPDIATEINKLNIDGLSVGVNTAGTMLTFKSRNDSNIVIDAAVSGLAPRSP